MQKSLEEIKKLTDEKESLDKKVAEVASQIKDLEEKLRVKDERPVVKRKEPKKEKIKEKLPENLRSILIAAAHEKEINPQKSSFVEPSKVHERKEGSGCCLVL